MSNQWIEPDSCKSLDVLVESVIAPLLIQHESAVCLEMDVPTDIPVPADASRTAELIRSLVVQALVEMDRGGELLVTACQSNRGLELEIADSGCDIDARPKSLPMVAAAVDAQLTWQNCPQGGAAVTITFGGGDASGRMAA